MTLGSPEQVRKAAEALTDIASGARVWVSMPVVDEITPSLLMDDQYSETLSTDEPLPRRAGIFPLKDAPLSVLDHLSLYGDGCFEGILIKHGQIFMWREHLDRLDRSARLLGIDQPFSHRQLTDIILRACQESTLSDTGYIRLVLSRGIGDLGINPAKCVAPTAFAIVSRIAVYPSETYATGIPIGLAKHVRRPGKNVLDPTIKTTNYINNVLALQEGTTGGELEALMLNDRGFIAEASVDNIFIVDKEEGWEDDPSKVLVRSPKAEYCLNGITRATLIELLRERGYQVESECDLVPIECVGPGRECFMTGTGAGVMPIISVAGVQVGDGKPGPVTTQMVSDMAEVLAAPEDGLAIDASDSVIDDYLSRTSRLPEYQTDRVGATV
ncbi:MAG: aminotransferase class IV [Acidobacteriota bacterium]